MNFFKKIGNDVMSMIPGVGDAMAQEKANDLNLEESQTNRDFQERNANTAYQRAMADMKAAGLNPTLAFQQGGAATPSGSTATVQSATKTGLADFALKATTGIGGLQTKQTALEQQQSMNNSSIQLNASSAAKNIADAERSKTETAKIREETKGLGRKAAEGSLWQKFYGGINNLIDSTSKDIDRRNKQNAKKDGPLIKSLGPADKKDQTPWLFRSLHKK